LTPRLPVVYFAKGSPRFPPRATVKSTIMDYKGKTVWITGASSGIGAALCTEMASKGANIVLTARREAELERVRMGCERPNDHMCLPLDVTQTASHESALEKILARFGTLDSVVLNAGIGQRGSVLESTKEVERHIMEVNYFSTTELAKTVLPHFLQRSAGQFVVVSSVMGFISTPRRATYAASKHALQGYFEGLRAELHQTNVSIAMICPGYIKTDISISSKTGSGDTFGSMDSQHRNAMGADVFARKAVRGLEKNKAVMFIGGPERFGPILARISPRLVRFLIPKVITRE
jgi:dehydrogenase/reductase SDR family member 7B